jgi:ankyrin repeat protein
MHSSAVTLATRILYAESDISQEIREILRRVLETAGEDGALPRSTLVHGAVLGLNTQGLDEALNIEPWALDKLDGSGFSPLHWAVKRGDLPAVQTLLDWRPNLNLKTPDGYAALHLAAESAFSDICAMLLDASSDPSARDRFGRTPLHFAVLNEDSATKLIESLLRTGVDLNSQTIRGDTPLHVLTNSLNYTRNIVAKLRLLGDSGADVDLCDFQGRTPLMGMLRNAGWQRDSLDVVRALLDLGARLDAVDSSGCNIFHNIALSSGPRLPIINFLRTLDISGVSPDAPSEDGKTPLTYLMDAATRKEVGVAYASRRPSKADVEAFIHLVREVRERNWGARMFLELKDKAGLNGEQQDLQEWREYFDRILNILDGEETEGITAEEENHDCHDETNDETFYDALESQLL